VLVVRLAASGLGQAAADHVADREQGDVEPDLVGGEVVAAPLLALDCVARDEEADDDREVREELGRLERRFRLGANASDRVARRQALAVKRSRSGSYLKYSYCVSLR
jgi:hypothetical protein